MIYKMKTRTRKKRLRYEIEIFCNGMSLGKYRAKVKNGEMTLEYVLKKEPPSAKFKSQDMKRRFKGDKFFSKAGLARISSYQARWGKKV